MPIHREAYGPYGLLSDRRMLAYDGSRFVGWLGVVRHEQAPDFSPEEERRLQRHARSFVDDIVAVARSEGRGGPENAHALFRPDGSAELACENARAWLDRHRIGALATRVRAVDQSRHAAATFALDGARAHLTRLSGEGPTRYLVVLTGARRPRVSAAARLTPRQREVAKLAATGARVVDVGRLLGISPETVRRHLKAVYARLLVANRVELAHALDDES
jgi:DNA-binding CsgD family transcriptional regulator